MTTQQVIISPIGKGQYTFPQLWRKALGIDKKKAKATFDGEKIIIEPLKKEKVEWDIRLIDFGELKPEVVQQIKASEEAYREGDTSKFLTEEEFWDV